LVVLWHTTNFFINVASLLPWQNHICMGRIFTCDHQKAMQELPGSGKFSHFIISDIIIDILLNTIFCSF